MKIERLLQPVTQLLKIIKKCIAHCKIIKVHCSKYKLISTESGYVENVSISQHNLPLLANNQTVVVYPEFRTAQIS